MTIAAPTPKRLWWPMRKAELRQLIRERKRQFSPQQLEELSLAAVSCLMKQPRIQQAKTVMLYHPLPDEVSTLPLLEQWNDKTLLLPRVIDDEHMELRRYSTPADLQKGAFGIMEPCGEPFSDYDLIDVAVIPGMAFDTDGHRLGRGRGYYDRFLSRVPFIYKIGLCFGFQLVGEVPTDENDIRMDLIISENGCRQ